MYLFGPHARSSASAISDIDVAVEALELLPPGLLAQIHEALDESTILRKVDLVDVARTSAEAIYPRLREDREVTDHWLRAMERLANPRRTP